MAKPVQSMYFAIKLIAPRVGDKRSLADSSVTTSATMSVTTHLYEEAVTLPSIGARHIRIGNPTSSAISGVAGHFAAGILDFSDAEDKKCKTLAEAEQLVKKHHKAWLADAYDWFVIPATINAGAISAGKPAKAPKSKK